MEVMSPLLLCALVVLTPQGLGKQVIKISTDIRNNNSIYINNNPAAPPKIINVNEALKPKFSVLQVILSDRICERCRGCMDKAVNEHKQLKKNMYSHSADMMRYDFLSSHHFPNGLRLKRDISIKDTEPLGTRKEKKNKSKKHKVHKTVTVTKYSVDGVVSVLKVKENYAPSDSRSSKTTCDVFIVNQSYACDSTDGELAINAVKRKSKKESKKEKKDKHITSTDPSKTPTQARENPLPTYRKREADNYAQLPENIMSSVEDY